MLSEYSRRESSPSEVRAAPSREGDASTESKNSQLCRNFMKFQAGMISMSLRWGRFRLTKAFKKVQNKYFGMQSARIGVWPKSRIHEGGCGEPNQSSQAGCKGSLHQGGQMERIGAGPHRESQNSRVCRWLYPLSHPSFLFLVTLSQVAVRAWLP